ncbi:carbohydrate sulfotransferase 11-like [Mizuhopecten yessoensis]|uniref:Carbohydrate sulfotransferase n=1 Tax=Mizuhopecten yessoensis TaxID=6573 RepID=A0A210R1A0_MIZYE|nr:carbohydrate sulfotransferase 11-like [Mizuhopecten yessoensis]OWF54820.1 Carbohydrate sulfotransferase 11 [Mizuhopecten yessoensis]
MRESRTRLLCVTGLVLLALYIGRNHVQNKKEIPHQAYLMYGQANPDEKVRETSLTNVRANNSNTSELRDIYKVRRDRVTTVCTEPRYKYRGQKAQGNGRKNILIDRPQRLAYCPIQKSASTFWKRVYRIVVGQSKATSPFDPSVPALKKFDSIALMSDNQADDFVDKSLSFMFVREPYGRLFSGYVDKLFSPNVMFWRNIGAFGISIFRKNPSSVDLRCGHDLTFSEFVKTVLYSDKHNIKRNGHFTPQYEHCDPCHYNYDVIGTLETLSEDTFYLLDRMGKTNLKKSLEIDFRGQSLNDTIRDQVNMLFAFHKGYRDCKVSFFEAQQRMWKKFQIRGVISKNSKYPIRQDQSERLTKETLTALIYQGMGDAVDKNVAKKNKHDALIEAFSTVDKKDMDSLSKLFGPDCELFGYDCRPSKLFDINTPITPWFFDINIA